MRQGDLLYLGHMLDVSIQAVAKVKGTSRKEFDEDENLRLAVTHLIQIPALGFCHLTLSVPKPLPPEYPRELRSVGDHLRQRRLDLGLLQREVAEIFGVTSMTVNAWETGRSEPKVSYMPRIIEFIGYDLFQGGMTFAERLRVKRWKLGLTQYQLARQLGVYKDTITLLETGKEVTNKRALAAVWGVCGRRNVERNSSRRISGAALYPRGYLRTIYQG